MRGWGHGKVTGMSAFVVPHDNLVHESTLITHEEDESDVATYGPRQAKRRNKEKRPLAHSKEALHFQNRRRDVYRTTLPGSESVDTRARFPSRSSAISTMP